MSEFRMTVQSVVHFADQGTVLQGVVETGSIAVGDKVKVSSPAHTVTVRVSGIEAIGTRELLSRAKEGDDVGLLIRGLDLNAIEDGVERDELTVRPTDLLVTRATKRWWEWWRS